jgi:hypothetical protein
MTRNLVASSAFALALLAAPVAHATDADLTQIREEIRQLKESYEARIKALEARLNDAEARAAGAPTPVATAAVAPADIMPVVVTAPPASSSGSNAFNPAISAVLQGVYANLSQDPNQYAIHGFVPSGDIAPAKRGFSIAESELTLSASVDDKIFGNLTFSLAPDNSVEVEEAYGVVTALPGGFTPKFGRFLSGIGYLNDQHQHVWDFYDAPLPYQAFLGGQFRNDGLQLKWLAPTDTFLEFGAEIGDGAAFPGSERNRNGIGDAAFYVHAGGDVGASNSWRAGVSLLGVNPRDRVYAQTDVFGNDAQLGFNGKSRLVIADFVWKYAPNGNARDTNFKLQGEYFWQRETGDLTYDNDGVLGLTQTSSYRSRQTGWYVQGVYQFVPAWRFGARYDRLDPGHVDYGANAAYLAATSFDPWRYSLMLDWTPSEFSRFRVQWQQSRLRPELTDNQLFIQYILTLGAHSAHKY